MAKLLADCLSMAAIALLVGTGCGGGDSDSDGKVSGDSGASGMSGASGIAGSKKVADLSDAEARQLCEWVNGVLYEPSKQELCTAGAVGGARSQAECEAYVPRCLEDDNIVTDVGQASCDDAGNDVRDDCSASVIELEDCYKDASAASRALFSEISCADTGNVETDFMTPASCKLVAQNCPGFLADDEDDIDGSTESAMAVSPFLMPLRAQTETWSLTRLPATARTLR